jgi:helix-turn-helix protein
MEWSNGNYSVTVHHKWRKAMLSEKKRYMWLLQRGQQVEVSFDTVQ